MCYIYIYVEDCFGNSVGNIVVFGIGVVMILVWCGRFIVVGIIFVV